MLTHSYFPGILAGNRTLSSDAAVAVMRGVGNTSRGLVEAVFVLCIGNAVLSHTQTNSFGSFLSKTPKGASYYDMRAALEA
jgi:hypothetical protein